MSSRDLIAATIVCEYAAAAARISDTIPVPDGHLWRANARHALRWFAGDVLESVRYGASIFLAREPPCWDDLDQLHVEVRLTWSRSAGALPDLAGRRAIVWVQQGPSQIGCWRDLLAPTSPFLHHDRLDPLLDGIVERLSGAIPRWRNAAAEVSQ